MADDKTLPWLMEVPTPEQERGDYLEDVRHATGAYGLRLRFSRDGRLWFFETRGGMRLLQWNPHTGVWIRGPGATRRYAYGEVLTDVIGDKGLSGDGWEMLALARELMELMQNKG